MSLRGEGIADTTTQVPLSTELDRAQMKVCDLQSAYDEALWEAESQRQRARAAEDRATALSAALEGCWSALVALAPNYKGGRGPLGRKVYSALARTPVDDDA